MKKKLNKVNLSVEYNPSVIKKTGELMSKMDLGIEKVVYPQKIKMSWTTTTEITKEYKDKITKGIIKLFEDEEHEVMKVTWTDGPLPPGRD